MVVTLPKLNKSVYLLIISLVVLGLGLTFTFNILGKAMGEFAEVKGDAKKDIINQMKETDKIVALSGATHTIKPAELKQIYIGFKNTDSNPKTFTIKEVKASSLSDNINCGFDENNDDVIMEYKTKPTIVQPTSTIVLPINIKAKDNTSKGTCIYELEISHNYEESIQLIVNIND